MNVRLARADDIPQMHRIRTSVRENRLADPSRVQPRHYEEVLRYGRGWVCEAGDTMVGFAIADLRTASVWALFVEPAYERQGVGRTLHDAMVTWMFASGLEGISLTTDPNTRAQRFYEAAGWRRVADAPNGEVRYELRTWVR